MRAARLSALITATGIAAMLLAGCSTPVPVDPGGETSAPEQPGGPVPAWYGDDLDGDGCPVPSDDSDLQRTATADAAAFLQAEVPADWCVYGSTEFTEYFAIPATEIDGFGSEVRATLEPAGWAFDAADDDSPQWSWITSFPDGAADGFEDGAVDGSIFESAEISQDDIDTYALWYGSLFEAFDEWTAGDYVSIVGFW
jgi:hypothetical protein